MFNLLGNMQNSTIKQPPMGNGAVKLHAAVNALKLAFADILDGNNYLNADINDPYVSFALSLFSKYHNDQDFQNAMTFPLPLPTSLSSLDAYQSLSSPQFQQQGAMPLPQNVISSQLPVYIYPENTPFLFSVFPPFFYLPGTSFSPATLVNDANFERLCFIGSSLFEYLIKITLYRKDLYLTPDDIIKATKAIINSSSLSILYRAYNIEFNYKFIGCTQPQYKIFLAYLGQYYGENIGEENVTDKWNTLFKWVEQLLGYQNCDNIIAKDVSNITSDTNNKPAEKTIESHKDDVFKFLGRENSHNEFKLQDLIQSVQQDLHQSVCATCEITYMIDEHPNLKTGMFSCVLFVNGVAFSSAKAMNKKLAKSGAALFAAIDRVMLKNLRRSYYDYWDKKYTRRENLIRRAFLHDSRFEYADSDLMSSSDSKSESAKTHELDDMTSSISPIPYNPSLEKDRTDVPLSTAKEKVYAYYNSKFNIVPKYEYQQLGNARFEAKLYLGNKLVSSAIATNKKDASAKAALHVIENNSDVL